MSAGVLAACAAALCTSRHAVAAESNRVGEVPALLRDYVSRLQGRYLCKRLTCNLHALLAAHLAEVLLNVNRAHPPLRFRVAETPEQRTVSSFAPGCDREGREQRIRQSEGGGRLQVKVTWECCPTPQCTPTPFTTTEHLQVD